MMAKTIFSIEEIPDDMVLEAVTLNEGEHFKLTLEFDHIYSEFFIKLQKKKDGELKSIIFSVDCLREILRQIPIILKIINRYSGSGKNIAFRFPVGKGVVLKVEESFGSVWLDIRKYFILNNEERPTKAGVKMMSDNAEKLQSVLASFVERIENCINISSDIMLHSYLALILKDIETTYDLKSPFCEGCKLNSPSQKDHTMEAGCMHDVTDMATKIDTHIVEACESVKMSEVKKLATKVSIMMNTPIISQVLDNFTVGQVKKMITDPLLDTQETFVVARNQG
jgi:hypothetical protein